MNKILDKKLNIVIVLTSLAISALFASNVNAETVLENASPSIIESVQKSDKSGGLIDKNISSGGVSVVQGSGSLSKAENYMNDKLGDVVHFLQSFIKPFTYIAFILSAISIVIGIITGSKSKFAGLIVMAFSIVVYMCVVFGPELVEYFAAWLSI